MLKAAQPGAVSFDEMMRKIRRELVLSDDMSTSSALSSACEQLGLSSDGTLEQKAARCYNDLAITDVDVVVSSHHDTDADAVHAEIDGTDAARNEPDSCLVC